MFSTLEKYASVDNFNKYFSISKKLKDANCNVVKKAVLKDFENSQNNIIRSVSLLYAGGLVSKRKYEQTRSALSTSSTGRKKTQKGYLQRRRMNIGFGYSIPKIISYKTLMSKINEINIGQLFSVREMLCSDLPTDTG